ncbi:DEAD/DEAH box helicase [Candidatus Pelagisphaera phototrophica]|uniref:DEAD/DEAH box helicase n=1 Tax=Candidatus Pelagisphaera phototrophica TaxID=2684113 RepID=UPI0024B7D3C0|nr:DEAD/DEAH box helicase [Candidatus Pelagisphaera phototrophica]
MEVIRSHQIAVLALLASIRAYYSLARRGSLGAYASTLKNFKELGVSAKLIKALSENKIVTPTEVQRVAIPHLLQEGGDFIAQAQTGTGKTAAFGVPLLQYIDPKIQQIQGLVLAPTRELAQQIGKQLFRFTRYFPDRIFSECVYGGEAIEIQQANLNRPTHIVVATPGRLIDLLKAKALDLSSVRIAILDEADEMLSLGFKKDLETILGHLPAKRRTWLFSATMPKALRKIIKGYMSPVAHAVRVDRKNVVNPNIDHQYVICRIEDKFTEITRCIKARGEERGLVFCRSRAGTVNLAKHLTDEGFSVGVIQGELSQKEREKVMRSFKKSRTQILVSTDVSARGIDVEDLKFVIHHQLPDQIEYYTHRSGRTARAGKSGVSIAFITGLDVKRLKEIERELDIRFKRLA